MCKRYVTLNQLVRHIYADFHVFTLQVVALREKLACEVATQFEAAYRTATKEIVEDIHEEGLLVGGQKRGRTDDRDGEESLQPSIEEHHEGDGCVKRQKKLPFDLAVSAQLKDIVLQSIAESGITRERNLTDRALAAYELNLKLQSDLTTAQQQTIQSQMKSLRLSGKQSIRRSVTLSLLTLTKRSKSARQLVLLGVEWKSQLRRVLFMYKPNKEIPRVPNQTSNTPLN